jgi:hypothetical protein
MLSVAIFVNHIRTTKITRFSPLGIQLMAIFKRAVGEPAHGKGYGPSPQTRNWTRLLQTLKKIALCHIREHCKEKQEF